MLDIGFGHGVLSIPLARKGAHVTSLDISPGMFNQSREIAKKEVLLVNPLECSWWAAEINEPGFGGEFDIVTASLIPAIKDLGVSRE